MWCLTQTPRFFFGSNTTQIVVLITNILLRRGIFYPLSSWQQPGRIWNIMLISSSWQSQLSLELCQEWLRWPFFYKGGLVLVMDSVSEAGSGRLHSPVSLFRNTCEFKSAHPIMSKMTISTRFIKHFLWDGAPKAGIYKHQWSGKLKPGNQKVLSNSMVNKNCNTFVPKELDRISQFLSELIENE